MSRDSEAFPWHALEAARAVFTAGLETHFDVPIGRLPTERFNAAFKAALLAYLSETSKGEPPRDSYHD